MGSSSNISLAVLFANIEEEHSGDRVASSAARVAAARVNADQSLLPGHTLRLTEVDISGVRSLSDAGLKAAYAQSISATVHETDCVAVIGCGYSSEAIVFAPLLGDLPLLSHSATSPVLSDTTAFPRFVRMPPPDTVQATAIADVLLALGHTTINVIMCEDVYCDGLYRALVDRAPGLVVSSRHFVTGLVSTEAATQQMYTQIVRSVIEDCSVTITVLLVHEWHSMAIFDVVQDIPEAKSHAWLGSEGTVGRLVLAGTLPNGFLAPFIEVDPLALEYQRMISTWEQLETNNAGRYPGLDLAISGADFFGALAYDAVLVVASALDKLVKAGQNNFSGSAILDALAASEVRGVTGNLNFDSNFDRIGHYTLQEYWNGNFRRVGLMNHGISNSMIKGPASSTENLCPGFPVFAIVASAVGITLICLLWGVRQHRQRASRNSVMGRGLHQLWNKDILKKKEKIRQHQNESPVSFRYLSFQRTRSTNATVVSSIEAVTATLQNVYIGAVRTPFLKKYKLETVERLRSEEGCFLLVATDVSTLQKCELSLLGQSQIWNEAEKENWRELSSFLRDTKSRHVLSVQDCVEFSDNSGFVMKQPCINTSPLMTLADMMDSRVHMKTPRNGRAGAGGDEAFWSEIALGVSAGLAAIHQAGFFHGKLTDRTILIDTEKQRAMIGDTVSVRQRSNFTVGSNMRQSKKDICSRDLRDLGLLLFRLTVWEQVVDPLLSPARVHSDSPAGVESPLLKFVRMIHLNAGWNNAPLNASSSTESSASAASAGFNLTPDVSNLTPISPDELRFLSNDGRIRVSGDTLAMSSSLARLPRASESHDYGHDWVDSWSGSKVSRMYQVVVEQLVGRVWQPHEIVSETERLKQKGYDERHIKNVLRKKSRVNGAEQAHTAFHWLMSEYSFHDIPVSSLHFGGKLGSGGYGVVYLASWHDQNVAVKTVTNCSSVATWVVSSRESPATIANQHDASTDNSAPISGVLEADDSDIERPHPARGDQSWIDDQQSSVLEEQRTAWASFRQEIEFAKDLRHPNVVTAYGCTFGVPPGGSSSSPMIVMEYFERGSLYDYIGRIRSELSSKYTSAQAEAGSTQTSFVDFASNSFPWRFRRRMSLEVASGMSFLHEKNVSHRDLKSMNVLVTRDRTCKICDFGQSRDELARLWGSSVGGINHTADTTSGRSLYGTVWWSAPEFGESCNSDGHLADAKSESTVTAGNAVRQQDYFAADVWSFGVLIWELLTLRRPREEYCEQLPTARTHPALMLCLLAEGKLELALSPEEERATQQETTWRQDAAVLKGLMEQAMIRKPKQRPRFAQLLLWANDQTIPASPTVSSRNDSQPSSDVIVPLTTLEPGPELQTVSERLVPSSRGDSVTFAEQDGLSTERDVEGGATLQLQLETVGQTGVRFTAKSGEWEVVRYIAHGGFSAVHEVRNKHSGISAAVKLLPIPCSTATSDSARRQEAQLHERAVHRLQRELQIAQQMQRHPNVVEWYDVVLRPRGAPELAIIFEYASGGDALQLIANGPMDESNVRVFMRQLIAGISHCHQLGICHRDLKLENLILGGEAGQVLKIADFGFSKSARLHSDPSTLLGSVAYVAPEVVALVVHSNLNKTYDGFAVDIWSVGVILYVLLTGALPFGQEGGKAGIGRTEIFRRILNREAAPFPNACTTEARALFERLCARDPVSRPKAKTIEDHMIDSVPIGFLGLRTPAALTRGLDWLKQETSYVAPLLRPPLDSTHSHVDLALLAANHDGESDKPCV